MLTATSIDHVPKIADGQDSQLVRTDSIQGIFRIEVAAICGG